MRKIKNNKFWFGTISEIAINIARDLSDKGISTEESLDRWKDFHFLEAGEIQETDEGFITDLDYSIHRMKKIKHNFNDNELSLLTAYYDEKGYKKNTHFIFLKKGISIFQIRDYLVKSFFDILEVDDRYTNIIIKWD